MTSTTDYSQEPPAYSSQVKDDLQINLSSETTSTTISVSESHEIALDDKYLCYFRKRIMMI